MADEEVGPSNREPIRPTEAEPYGWIAEEVFVSSSITHTSGRKFISVEERIGDAPSNWAAHVVGKDQRVFSDFGKDGFAMYEFAFERLWFRMPFSDFAMAVFKHQGQET
ncbi:hypothetical protein A2U01_0003114, partial [Trifolium medium]|nr:hypothetical protein [Trifolium medium]